MTMELKLGMSPLKMKEIKSSLSDGFIITTS